MKALIVDDEKHVRDAVRMLVDWESYGIDKVLEAADGAAAVELIRAERPEIVFTDMLMPVMHGTELLEWIETNCPGCKTIVISGHDDFELVRHTIKHGGMDYILKPIDEEQLNEVLRKAVETVAAEKRRMVESQEQRIRLNQIQPMYWDKLFSSLTEDPGVYTAFAGELEAEFAIPPETEARAAAVGFETLQPAIRDKFASNLDLLSFAIGNIANEFLRDERCGYAFRHWSKPHELVIVAWRDAGRLPRLIERINEGIHGAFGVRFDFGVGDIQPFPQRFPATYREAVAALKQRNLLESGSRIHLYSAEPRPHPPSLRFDAYEEPMRLAILNGGMEAIRAAVDRWFRHVRTLGVITLEQLDLWKHEFAVFLARCRASAAPGTESAEPQGTEDGPDFEVPVDEEGRLSIPSWQEEVTRALAAEAERIARTLEREKPNVIRDIADYIRTHYREELSLHSIAETFHLSREYISRRFKQETNENISDFLARIRIDNAKLLLGNPQLRVVQIAEMVGFQDEKYFSKVFKKLTGMSPNEFRKEAERTRSE